MKLCWDNLEGIILGKRSKELRKGHYTYVERDSCANCGQPYLMNKYKPTNYCCISCGKLDSGYKHSKEIRKKIGEASLGNKNRLGKKHSIETRKILSIITSSKIGKQSSRWKGGVTKKNLPLYDTFAEQINWSDNVRCIKKEGLSLMGVTCTKCGKWYVPKVTSVHDRLKYLKGQTSCEYRFYCSEKCKSNCEVYGQKIWTKHNKPRKKQEFNGFNGYDLKIWRLEVLRRANYRCIYCNNKAEIAHHIKPKKLEPFFALDPDNGVACCKECHNKYCHKDECSTWSLSRIECR